MPPRPGTEATEVPPMPLAGIRVVEFSGSLAAAYCGKLFADAGADVIQIEADCSAGRRTPLEHYLDAGKRSVVVGEAGGTSASGHTATQSRGPDGLLDRLLASADIIVGTVTFDATGSEGTNGGTGDGPADAVRPQKAGRYGDARGLRTARVAPESATAVLPGGLSVGEVRARYPGCVLVTLSPFGTRGPWAGYPGNDFTLQAWGGSTARRGDAERGPLAAGGDLTDWSGGAVAAVGALGVLLGTAGTGRGEHVDVSLLEVATLVFNGFMAVAGQLAPPPGPPREPRPYTELPSVVRAADGWVGFATNSAAQFRAFAEMVGHPEWADHPEYSRADRRGLHAAELAPVIDAWAGERSVDEITALARARAIPVAPVGNGRETPGFDHMRARGSFVTQPGQGFLRPVAPYRLSDAATRPPTEAPERGAHTAELAAELTCESTSHGSEALAAGARLSATVNAEAESPARRIAPAARS
ncbi:MAG: hypothetical protein HOV68_13670, partial [Streptomycetaceae bacterium]|nr:hypothetical protein [Streptomycetaceae bacterium]